MAADRSSPKFLASVKLLKALPGGGDAKLSMNVEPSDDGERTGFVIKELDQESMVWRKVYVVVVPLCEADAREALDVANLE